MSRRTHFFLSEYCRFLKMWAVLAIRCSTLNNLDDDWWSFMLMTLIRSRLQGRELKQFSCVQVQDHLRFIDFTSEREAYMRFLCVRLFYESYVCSADPRLLGALRKTVSLPGGGGGGGGRCVEEWMKRICPCFTPSRIALAEGARETVSLHGMLSSRFFFFFF